MRVQIPFVNRLSNFRIKSSDHLRQYALILYENSNGLPMICGEIRLIFLLYTFTTAFFVYILKPPFYKALRKYFSFGHLYGVVASQLHKSPGSLSAGILAVAKLL